MIKGVICDLDGFLVETWKTEPLPGVVETLAELRRRGIPIAVATNQAGPLWRLATGDAKYPTIEDVAARLQICAKALALTDKEPSGYVAWYIALADDRAMRLLSEEAGKDALKTVFYDFIKATRSVGIHAIASDSLEWRKPSPRMLYAACVNWNILPEEAIYGGDMDSDRQAAQSARMRFIETLPSVMTLLESEG